MRIWLNLMALFCCCLQSLGQSTGSYIFRHLGPRDGLLHSTVYAISQDSEGYMWIGSVNGLQRYDGIRFTNFQKGISTLSSQAAPANIYTGNKGNVWLTCGSLVKLDKAQNRITVFDTTSLYSGRNFTFTAYRDKKGYNWYLGDYGLYVPDTSSGRRQSLMPLVPNYTAQTGNAAVRLRSGEVWVSGGLNLLFAERNKMVYSVDYNPINHPLLRFLKETNLCQSLSFILPDRLGNYWLATWDGRLVFFEKATGKSKSYSVPASAKAQGLSTKTNAAMIAICLYEDSRGTVWAGTNYAGLLRFDSTMQRFSPVPAKDVSGYGVDYNFSFHCITEDREGNLWLGTDKGINIFHPYRQYFQTISAQRGDENSLPDFEITSTLGLRNGDVLVTTWGGGFCVYDSSFKRKAVVQPPGPYQYTMTWDALEATDGTVWIGAQHGFLYRYQPKQNKWEISRPPEMMSSTIRCLAGDGAGNIFMGLHNGHVVKWNALENRFIRSADSSKQAPVINMLIHQNKIWAATENGLLLTDAKSMKEEGRFIPASTEFPGGIKKQHGLAVLNDTVLMIGTRNAGLFFFHIKTRKFFRESALASIEQQSVFAVQKAADGSVWFTTDYALYRFTSATKKLWKLKPEEGRINASFLQCSFRPTASGKWLTSSQKEVVCFNPSAGEIMEAEAPSVVLTGFKVLEENLPVDSLHAGRKIALKPHQNFITFYFSDLRYDGVRDHVYYHRLSGVDEDWVPSASDGQANYTNLSPGDYVFEVKGDGSNNVAVEKWFITISAPFHATAWFRAILLVLIGGGIFWAVRRRMGNIRRQSALKQRIAEAEVSALRAQMNPHFIFNCLSAIDNMIETDQKEKATTYLNRFARLIRSVLESSKKSLVPLQSDMETLKLYLELEQFRCDNRFTYKISADPQVLNGDYKIPPLVIQPYVENAIHHGLLNLEGDNGRLELSLATEGNCLVYRIKDNGVGRMVAGQLKHPAQKRQASYGMAITEERIRMFNGNQIQNPVVVTDLFAGDEPAGTLIEVFLKTD